MADTPRTQSELLSAFRDNVSNAITPQNMRDFVVSVPITTTSGGYGSLNSTASTLQALTVSVPSKITLVTTLLQSRNFDMPADNRLRYIGTDTGKFKVAINFSAFESTASADVFLFEIYKNGAATGIATRQGLDGTTADEAQSVVLGGMLELATNDYIEVFVTNETDSDDVTIESIQFDVFGVI